MNVVAVMYCQRSGCKAHHVRVELREIDFRMPAELRCPKCGQPMRWKDFEEAPK